MAVRHGSAVASGDLCDIEGEARLDTSDRNALEGPIAEFVEVCTRSPMATKGKKKVIIKEKGGGG